MDEAEYVASKFHETYEALAPAFGYVTRRASAIKWEEVIDPNRSLMIAVARDLIDRNVISVPGF